MRGPAEEILPLPGIEVEVRNDLLGMRDVEGMENDIESVESDGEYTTIRLDSLRLHEILTFE